MGHYKSNLRDVQFNLFELLGRRDVYGRGPFADIDEDTARTVLTEVDRLAHSVLAEAWEDSDRNPPVFNPSDHSVTMPKPFAEAYQAWMDAEWWRLQVPREIGGDRGPASLVWSMSESVLGANPGLWVYATSGTVARILFENGIERDQTIARHLLTRRWGGTMVLTEADAGSDVGACRAKARLNEDGTWAVEGVKRFITAAEHDMSENIMHLVLARPQGVEGVGGPGTKGLSLFLVPKFHFDHETGELTGERNGAYVTNVEKKMGLKVSATCEMSFGDPSIGGGEPAVGWLLGEVHDGINQMFRVIENARMMVGAKAIATLSTGYLNALAYAKERVQGADLTQSGNKAAPRVTITHHPDVRRSLMTQKAYAEGLRSLMIYTATWQDDIMMKEAAGEDTAHAESVNDLLLPIVKGYGSERSWTLLGTESLQTLGGSGFLQDYPIEQYVRDAKIDTLYEGTTAIQGQDLFFRKIAKDRGAIVLGLLDQVIDAASDGRPEMAYSRTMLATAVDDVRAIIHAMIADLASSHTGDGGGRPENIYKVALNTSRLLFALGDVLVGWLLLRSAEIALAQLDADPSPADRSFYEGKIAAAQFFACNVLPLLAGERAIAENVDGSIMELDEAAF